MGILFAPRLSAKSMSIQQSQSVSDSASNYEQEGSDPGERPGIARGVRELSADFKPNEFTVLCGRGSLYAEASGNQYLKRLIQQSVPAYSNASNRTGKSGIVSMILQAAHAASPEAAFVKFEDGQWREVDDATAREKIGTIFRDLLHDKYKSSNKAKVAKRSMRRNIGKHDNRHGALDMSVGRLSFPLRQGGPTVPTGESSSNEDSLSSISFGAAPQLASLVPKDKTVPQDQPHNKSIDAEDTVMSWNSSLSFFQQVDGASLPTASTLVDCDIFGDDDDHARIRMRGKPGENFFAGRGWTRLDS